VTPGVRSPGRRGRCRLGRPDPIAGGEHVVSVATGKAGAAVLTPVGRRGPAASCVSRREQGEESALISLVIGSAVLYLAAADQDERRAYIVEAWRSLVAGPRWRSSRCDGCCAAPLACGSRRRHRGPSWVTGPRCSAQSPVDRHTRCRHRAAALDLEHELRQLADSLRRAPLVVGRVDPGVDGLRSPVAGSAAMTGRGQAPALVHQPHKRRRRLRRPMRRPR
jgi:hypothetical protein